MIAAPFDVADFREPTDFRTFVALETLRRRVRLARLLGIEDPVVRKATLNAEAENCRRDLCYRFENYGWMLAPKVKDPRLRVIPFVPWPAQRRLVRFLLGRLAEADETGVDNVAFIVKGREAGVTWTIMHILHALWCEEIAFRSKVGSRKEELVEGNADSMFAMLRFVNAQQPDFLRPPFADSTMKLENLATGGEIAGESTNEGFGRGGRRRVVVVDEMAHILPIRKQSEMLASLRSVAASTWLNSTPRGRRGKFAALYRKLPAEAVFEMDWTADPRRPENFRDIMIAGGMTPEEFDQEFGAKFVNLQGGNVWHFPEAAVAFDDGNAEWLAVRDLAVTRFPLVGGWDFGSGASDLVCLLALVELRQVPRLWVVDELVWNETEWDIAARDVRSLVWQRKYKGRAIHYGDPAGIAKESNQESWSTNLNRGGVPLRCLDSFWNERVGIEWSLKLVGKMLNGGHVRVHRRCTSLWESLREWRRDIPEGQELFEVARSYIPPRPDGYSHAGQALRYMVAGALHAIARQRKTDAARRKAAEEGKTLGAIPPEERRSASRDISAMFGL